MYAILLSGSLFFGPADWNPQAFQQAMGVQTVSLPAVPPSGEIDAGGYAIVPVTVTVPDYDPKTQQVVAGSPVVIGNTVTMTYTVQQVPAPPPAQQAANLYGAAIGAGLQITSTLAPTISGVYAIDDTTELHINSERTSMVANGVFTNGQATKFWPFLNGGGATLTMAQFTQIATAIGQYKDALLQAQATAALGQSVTWPTATAQIP